MSHIPIWDDVIKFHAHKHCKDLKENIREEKKRKENNHYNSFAAWTLKDP